MLDPILDAFVTPIMKFLQIYVRKAVAAQNYSVPYQVNALFHVLCHLDSSPRPLTARSPLARAAPFGRCLLGPGLVLGAGAPGSSGRSSEPWFQ